MNKLLLIGTILVAIAACSGQRQKNEVETVAAKTDSVAKKDSVTTKDSVKKPVYRAYKLPGRDSTAIPMKAVELPSQHYDRVDTYPQYPDGSKALIETLTLPILDKDERRRTIVNFYVEKDGSLSDFEVVKSSGSDVLDEKALQAVKGLKSPWRPGKTDGKAVRVPYTVPVTFIPRSSTR